MVKRKYEKANVIWLNESDKLVSNVIYLLTFNDNGREMYYVGKTSRQLRDRIYGHATIILNSKQLVLQAISKLKHFTVSILCKCNSIDELKAKEEYYTLQYRSNEREFGYNLCVGHKWCQDKCRELSDMKIKFHSDNPNARKKIGDYNRGKILSDIEIKRLTESHTVKCKSIPDNIIFDSIKQCRDYYSKYDKWLKVYDYLDNGKTHKKSGQTFVRLG